MIEIRYVVITGFVLLALLLVACQPADTAQDEEKLNVLVSILPQKAFVQAVAGDLVAVQELIPPGASPATYEPQPSDLVAVEKADIYFRIGYIPFEDAQLKRLASLNPDMNIVDTSQGVDVRYVGEDEEHDHEEERHAVDYDENHSDGQDLTAKSSHKEGSVGDEYEIEHDVAQGQTHDDEDAHDEDYHEDEHDHSGVDPHIWLSPVQVKKQVDVITQTLATQDPQNKAAYEANAQRFKQELDLLHNDIQTELSRLKTDKLMVFHPAWGYFADEYGLKQIAIEALGKEPTAERLQRLIEIAKDEDIKVIFVQSQFNKEIAQSVADEIGAVVISIDPLSDDYLNNLRTVATTISENLT